jgi:CheY-like chemotaxis protein
MSPETRSKLFVPFEQADRARSNRYGGLGLGLAISKALVDLLKGELSAESPGRGHGSTFRVRFPTIDPAQIADETAATPIPPPDQLRLLLIEDHDDTARTLSRLLEKRGFGVKVASSVARGLETLQQDQFDLLLCDLGLPDGTGIDFIEKVRARQQTPAIALTGYGMQEDVERAQKAGFDAHLTKPVNLQKLEATIWQLLQKERIG